MKLSDRGLFALALHEGIVPAPYLDSVGVWTYGVGHTKAAGDPDPKIMPRGMPKLVDAAVKDALKVFKRDVAKYEAAVSKAVTVKLEQHEFDALVSFHYNTGGIHRANLTKRLNAGDRAGAAKGFMSWRKPAAIIPRREDEQALFRDGSYPSGKVIVWGVNDAGQVLWKPRRSYTMSEFLALLRPPVARPEREPAPTPRGDGKRLAAAIATALAAAAGALSWFWDSLTSILGG